MSTPTATAGISPREAEILTLVGEHRSNAEIGAQLFISVRTVETHVSSLLRKLGAPDRRALADLAAEAAQAERTSQARAGLPAPLSPFIGRARERAELRDAVKAHRQVTAAGPGGVGKTRLALAVAAEAAGDFPDGVWFVDLVPVTDPAMVGSAVAAALGLGEQQGRSIDDSVLAALADRHALLVLDNCEHLPDGVAPFVERLLARCPYLSVLTTSRARLLVPFERVYSVPPLSLDGDDADAVALFVDRATAVGGTVSPSDQGRSPTSAGSSTGWRWPSSSPPPACPHSVSTGWSRACPPTCGSWSAGTGPTIGTGRCGPCSTGARRCSASPTWPCCGGSRPSSRPSPPRTPPRWPASHRWTRGRWSTGWARLADQSLLTAAPSAAGTRYRALETIRQHGIEQLTETGELAAARAQHLRWCLTTAATLGESSSSPTGEWRARFDAVAADLRAAVGWAATQPEHDDDARGLAMSLAVLAFARNLAEEAQQRYEQAAGLGDDTAAAAAALRSAARVAACRMRGDDSYRLWQSAADVALRAGDTAGAARDLATATTSYFRMSGIFTQRPPPDEATALLARAEELAGDDPAGQAAVVLAECGARGDVFLAEAVEPQTTASETIALAERAVELARRLDDPLAESAALDALTGAQHLAGDTFAAAATALRRVSLLESVPLTPATADEVIDALVMATETSIGVGDLAAARHWGRQLCDVPLLAEVGHFATSRLLVTDALAGRAGDVIPASRRFLDAWTQAGRPATSSFGPAAAAVALIHDLRGDQAARDEWHALLARLGVTPERRAGYCPTFDAIGLLHRSDATGALDRLTTQADETNKWLNWIWLHWHVALRAEAAVLARHPDAGAHLATARPIVAGNPVATAIVDRAAALSDRDPARLSPIAAAFATAGCPYQQARTLILAGPDTTAAGHAALVDLGLSP